MSVNITDNPNFKQQLLAGFRKSVELYEEQARTEIKTVKWSHPRETTRRNGQTVGSPRDIVDTGELSRSQQPATFAKGGKEAEVKWDADYALYVHEGVTYSNGTTTPPKRWTESAFTECDRQGKFQTAFDEALK